MAELGRIHVIIWFSPQLSGYPQKEKRKEKEGRGGIQASVAQITLLITKVIK